MSKHTPGPWEIKESDYGDEVWFGGEGCGLIEVNGWYSGGNKKYPDDWKQTQANARLIAAAPDLLEALKRLLKVVEPEDSPPWDAGSEVEQARAAIAKAEGNG